MSARTVTNEPISFEEFLRVSTGGAELVVELSIPDAAEGLVVFCHGRRNRRHGEVNLIAASLLTEAGFGAAVCNLLTPAEESGDEKMPGPRFDIPRLAGRLADVTDALGRDPRTSVFPIGYFAASTLAAAALVAAASRPLVVRSVVSLGGLPELAGEALARVKAPTLLLVGERDWKVVDRNTETLESLRAEKSLVVVPEGSHLFAEKGPLGQAVALARDWYQHTLRAPAVVS